MGQKVFIFSLIFVMVVVLFTGCGKKTTPDPLEGTWQFKEQVYKVKGLPVEEESYKFPHKIYPEKYKDKNVYLMEERYYQFRNNIRTTILHLSIAGDLTDEIKDVIKSEINGLPDEIFSEGLLIKSRHDLYSIDGNKLMILGQEEQMTFNINEGKMNLRFKDENYDEEKIITLVKVADSEVSGAQDIEKIPGLSDLISEDQSTNRK